MTARRTAIAGLGAALVAVVLVVVLAAGEEPYRLRLVLDNAHGLRAGSDVRVGDITVGRVGQLDLGPRDEVVAELELDPDHAPVGRDASLAISSLNLLGHKYVALDRGDPRAPAPSGFTIRRSRISVSTDLDQLLNVLDGDTRARLAVLINEAGFAMTGRRADFNALLRELPDTVVDGTRLLEELVSDNHTLAHLVERSDAFMVEVSRERRSLSRMIAAVGETSTTFAARRRQLRQTLARAPGMLRTLRQFLAELQSTTVPLGPAARNVTATAPALTRTLHELEPFRRAAAPALTEARALAPGLERLASGATPVLQGATSTVQSLATVGRELVPVTDALDGSAYNILAIMHNWSRAIQFRDGLGHVFNGALSITPETFAQMVRRLTGTESGTRRDRTTRARPRRDRTERPERTNGAPPPARGETPRLRRLPDLPRELTPPVGPGPGSVPRLLDFLLGP